MVLVPGGLSAHEGRRREDRRALEGKLKQFPGKDDLAGGETAL
jgi:hypothetical protein